MPELPEVETTRRGIAPHIRGHTVRQVIVRHRQLRWPIPANLAQLIVGHKACGVERRAKYLLIKFDHGTLIVHLGMTGTLRMYKSDTPAQKHDHLDVLFENGQLLRFNDPRRFGAVLWSKADPAHHTLLKSLGPEPLSSEFNTSYLLDKAHKRRCPVKTLIMDNKVVVGVGNIYASEALFVARVCPTRSCATLTQPECKKLVDAIRAVLKKAIKKGGTTLQDFTQPDGKPGYFSLQLNVYGRTNEPCKRCSGKITSRVIGQRNSFWCPACQK